MTGKLIAITHDRYFSTTLISDVVGSLARTYIPLFALSGNISFKITMNSKEKAFIWGVNPAAGNVSIDRIECHANIVHLKPKILDLVAQPSY